ncbi:MAG: hypothetical protein KA444_01770 [Bacteroidia bacterium]|nr:hypothetical protein [Bacteroidia bacterium]
MRFLFCIAILFCFCVLASNAQKDSIAAKNLVFLEFLGSGGYGSINYERLLSNKENLSVGLRAGLSTYHINDYTHSFNPDLIFPLSVQCYYGRNHHLELGLGQTISAVVRADPESFSPEREYKSSSTFCAGYRYQKPGGGISFRLVYNPILEFNSDFLHWVGVSIGYAFKD